MRALWWLPYLGYKLVVAAVDETRVGGLEREGGRSFGFAHPFLSPLPYLRPYSHECLPYLHPAQRLA